MNNYFYPKNYFRPKGTKQIKHFSTVGMECKHDDTHEVICQPADQQAPRSRTCFEKFLKQMTYSM